MSRFLCGLRKFFRYLREQGYIKANPALEVSFPMPHGVIEYTVLRPEVVETLLTEDFGCNIFTTLRNRMLICLFLRCGLHPCEVCNLFLCDIVGNSLKIRRRKKFRIVEMDVFTLGVLKDYLPEREHFLRWRRASSEEYLICASTPRSKSYRLSTAGLQAIISRSAKILWMKYGYDIKSLCALSMAHTSRLFNWIVMDTLTQDRKETVEFAGSMGHVFRGKVTESIPNPPVVYQDFGVGI